MDRAAHDAPRSPTDVDGWAADAFGLLGGLSDVGRVGLALDVRPLGPTDLRGKSEPVEAFELLSVATDPQR